jgi:transposase
MIPSGVDVFLAVQPIDLRWGFDRLAGLVSGHLERDARSGALYVFFGKRREALKVLFFDGTGYCLFYKRLDRGVFRLPEGMGEGTSVQLEESALDALLDGVDVEAPAHRARRASTH